MRLLTLIKVHLLMLIFLMSSFFVKANASSAYSSSGEGVAFNNLTHFEEMQAEEPELRIVVVLDGTRLDAIIFINRVVLK